VNLRGVVNGVSAAYRVMLAQGFGHIVNTASVQGLVPTPLMTSYGATKHAVVALSVSLRIEAAAAGVRVSVVCPGVIRTPLLTGGRYGRVLVAASAERQRAYFERLRPMEPARFARRVLVEVARNKAIIVVPSRYKAMWWLNRLSPSLGMSVAAKVFAFSKRTLTG
jgi:short-subunit dehydrogenase